MPHEEVSFQCSSTVHSNRGPASANIRQVGDHLIVPVLENLGYTVKVPLVQGPLCLLDSYEVNKIGAGRHYQNGSFALLAGATIVGRACPVRAFLLRLATFVRRPLALKVRAQKLVRSNGPAAVREKCVPLAGRCCFAALDSSFRTYSAWGFSKE